MLVLFLIFSIRRLTFGGGGSLRIWKKLITFVWQASLSCCMFEPKKLICSLRLKIVPPIPAQGAFSDALRRVQLGVVDRRDCERRLREQPRFRKSGFQVGKQGFLPGHCLPYFADSSEINLSNKRQVRKNFLPFSGPLDIVESVSVYGACRHVGRNYTHFIA